VDSPERAQVFVQIEDQYCVAGLGQLFVPLDLRVGGVDDDSQTTDGGPGRGDHSLDHRRSFDFEPGLVPIHSRASTAGLDEPHDRGLDCGLRIGALGSGLRDRGLSLSVHSDLPSLRLAAPNCVIGLISRCFSKSAIRNPQSAIAYVILPGKIALSAIGKFQIKR
jgi:hypothetical protein